MTSYGLPSDTGKYCIVVNYVLFEANKIKFKPNQPFCRTYVEKTLFFLNVVYPGPRVTNYQLLQKSRYKYV